MATGIFRHLLCVFLGVSAVLDHVAGLDADSPFCATTAELALANVAGRILGGVDILSLGNQTLCVPPVDPRYRSLDGRCNHPLDYGSVMKPVKRYLRADYDDRRNEGYPRTFSKQPGWFLPPARQVSRKLHTDRSSKDSFTLWVMQIGQFIDHDITSAPVPTEEDTSIKCCGVPIYKRHPECFPIAIALPDRRFQSNCMEFVRSEPVKDGGGRVVYPREQLNALTAFIDGSVIYGQDFEHLHRLRENDGLGALLKTMTVNGRERLPQDTNAESGTCVRSDSPQSYCQLSGDERVNEQPGLGSAHLLFHLYHNHLVRALTRGILSKYGLPSTARDVEVYLRLAPPKMQEKIFQEARKIMGAVLQKIVYCEWLPLVVGPDLIRKYSLSCEGRSAYSPAVDPRISNGFLTAAFRFGHSLIPNKLSINGVKLDLRDQFMVPDANLRYYESIIDGLTRRRAMKFDRHVVKALTNHLFQSANGPEGALDLVSLNIQRGRDHGIPDYNRWRIFYGLKSYTTFADFKRSAQKIRDLYRDVRDVDLFVGGLAEDPEKGALVGETFGNIIANQFADTKHGDAFFFQREETPKGFTDAQLAVIRKLYLRDVICTTGGVNLAQENVFLEASQGNPRRPCWTKYSFDIGPWMKKF